MELKEYLKILKLNQKIFWAVVLVSLIIGFSYDWVISHGYTATLSLNVARVSSQETANYKYDGFYRLQADERFADTLVRWLGSPRIVVDILNNAGLTENNLSAKQLGKIFQAQRLSSQYVVVEYSAPSAIEAKKMASSVVKILNKQTEELNKAQQESAWFLVLADEPVIRQNSMTPAKTLIFSLFGGIFLGLWGVLIRHYLKKD